MQLVLVGARARVLTNKVVFNQVNRNYEHVGGDDEYQLNSEMPSPQIADDASGSIAVSASMDSPSYRNYGSSRNISEGEAGQGDRAADPFSGTSRADESV